MASVVRAAPTNAYRPVGGRRRGPLRACLKARRCEPPAPRPPQVTEELLVEAHSGEGEHVWWVDLQFFVGFLASFLLEKFTGGGDE